MAVDLTITEGSAAVGSGTTFVDIYQDVRTRLGLNEEDDTLIKGYVNDRYKEVANAREWPWLYEKTSLVTVAEYDTGTVAVTEDNTTVTGTGTAWTSAMAGRKIRVTGFDETYEIDSVDTNAQTLTLKKAYNGDTESGASYKIFQDILSLPSDTDEIIDLRQHRCPRALTLVGLRELRNLSPSPYQDTVSAVYADPTHYAHYVPDSSEYMTIILWPPPYRKILIDLEYKKIVVELTNDSDTPLIPEHYRQILKHGAMADMYGKRDENNRQNFWEGKFINMLRDLEGKFAQKDDLKKLTAGDRHRRSNLTLQQMADRYDMGEHFDRW